MKSIFEQLGGTYHEESGYLIPDLELPAEKGEIASGKPLFLRLILWYIHGEERTVRGKEA